jgi:transcriptional regulator with GAF, ATPase, and Fis domain
MQSRFSTPDWSTLTASGVNQMRGLQSNEKDLILQALDQTRWNRTAAAKLLGMTFRQLRYRIKKYGLDQT